MDEGPHLSGPLAAPTSAPAASKGAGQKDVRKNTEDKRWDGGPLGEEVEPGGNKEWSQHRTRSREASPMLLPIPAAKDLTGVAMRTF